MHGTQDSRQLRDSGRLRLKCLATKSHRRYAAGVRPFKAPKAPRSFDLPEEQTALGRRGAVFGGRPPHGAVSRNCPGVIAAADVTRYTVTRYIS